MGRPLRIAIDGPAGSGKGTVARLVARRLGYVWVDTGTLYRAVAWLASRQGLDLGDDAAVAALAGAVHLELLWDGDRLVVRADGEDVTAALRAEDVGHAASRVAALPGVRAALLDVQHALTARGGVVMDGRDVGSVIMPDADLKAYLDAAPDERARRRQEEMRQRGLEIPRQRIAAEMRERDALDSQRAVAPLVRLPDAWYLDTTRMTAEQAADLVVAEASARGA